MREAVALAQGMEVKHSTFNTGFAGAKIVCDVGPDADPSKINKDALLNAARDMLDDFQGGMFTGCDLNVSLTDMERLASADEYNSQYVLAGIGNPEVDPNVATAFGVVGALRGAYHGRLRNKRFVVHGCGAVGKTVAELLVAFEATVFVCDAVHGRAAAVAGAVDISDSMSGQWVSALPEHDCFVPCSCSHLLDEQAALALPATAVIGAANLPFTSVNAANAFTNRSGGKGKEEYFFIPEGVTSAGAVIADSIEFMDAAAFRDANPLDIYQFTMEAVERKTALLRALANDRRMTCEQCTPLLSSSLKDENQDLRLGSSFRMWLAERQHLQERQVPEHEQEKKLKVSI